MESLVQLFNKWEIQLLVLLSFTLQMFLFFAGNLRRRSASMLLRLSIWMAYLGADLVAIYALGYFSRHVGCTTGRDALMETHPLAFLWTPFLLVHLGGQDTVNAFAMEDNNLWLRHFFNLMGQVGLALYVFWKSIGNHSVHLLVPGIFMFVAGIIKYGERTWALKCGRLKSFGISGGGDSEQAPQMTGGGDSEQAPQRTGGYSAYPNIFRSAQRAMAGVRGVFGERRTTILGSRAGTALKSVVESYYQPEDYLLLLKLFEIELGMIYDDLYTKAMVLRTKSGIILRCISQISVMVALALFLLSKKQRYSRADVAITYVLFLGSLFLEACAMLIFMASPWTWKWLDDRKWRRLAVMSWRLLSSNIGWPQEGLLWSGKMGQFNFNMEQRSCKQRVMQKMIGFDKLDCISKLLGTKYVKVDHRIMSCFVRETAFMLAEAKGEDRAPRQWRHLGPVLKRVFDIISATSFGRGIGFLQQWTEKHLSRYPPPPPPSPPPPFSWDGEMEEPQMVDICRKVSSYMAYLFVTHTSLVPGGGLAEDVMCVSQPRRTRANLDYVPVAVERRSLLSDFELPQGKETLEELRDMWIRLLVYVAGKSSPQMHAEQLARGGELLTFLWLYLSHGTFGDAAYVRIELSNFSGLDNALMSAVHIKSAIYSFYIPEVSPPQDSTSVEAAPVD